MEVKPPNFTSYQKEILYNDARFTITEASTKAGKTFSHIAWLYMMATKGDIQGRNYWWCAPVYNQAKIAFNRLRRNLAPTGLYRFNESNLVIYMPNGAEMHFKSAEKPDNLYGEDVYAAVFDEAPRARKEAWYALRSTLSATEAPCKLIGNFGGISNWVHKLKDKAKTDPKYKYFKITCWDAVKEGILSKEEVLQAKEDLPEKIFKELYEAEASESDGQLIQNESIQKVFSNTHIEGGTKYITADIARLGNDMTVILVWDSLRVIEVVRRAKNTISEAIEIIKELRTKHNVNLGNIIVDEDGVGGGVVDGLRCKGFVNGSKAIKVKGKSQNFANLKSQCGYKLAEMINANNIYVDCDEDTETKITEELEWVRLPKEADYSALRLMDKDSIKKNIGRSPDYSDALMMRMYYELDPSRGSYLIR